MAVSLYEAALIAEADGQNGPAGVMKTFARSAPLLQAMPIESILGGAYTWTREVSLGTNAFRNVGGSFSESTGQSEMRSIPLKIIGGDLDVDTFLIKTQGANIRPQKVEAKAADLAQRIAYNMIKGSVLGIGGSTADPKGFDGLQVRYGGGFGSTAVVDAGENANQIIANTGGSDALSMRDLDIAIQATERPTHLIVAKKMKINIAGYLRSSGTAIFMTADAFGTPVMTYAGLPIIEADTLGTVSGLEALGFNENNDSTTSIYVVSMGDEGLHLVTNGGVQTYDLGQLQTQPVYRTRVEWYCNVVDPSPRCVTRLYNIADLVAVA